jgi:phage/plasmid primase, P4 family, C-terminal domain
VKFTAILERFAEVSEETDGGYLALCGAHQDSRPSLRVWCGDDGKVRLTCRAGCSTDDVRKAAGLSWSDLFNAEADATVVPKARPELISGETIADLTAYVAATSAALPQSKAADEYLFRRFGLTSLDAAEFGIGFDDDPANLCQFKHRSAAFTRYPRITVPFLGFDGVARGLQGRDITGRCAMRWVGLTNPQGQRWAPYGTFQGAGGYSVVIVTEGPGDGLTALSVGYDVVMIRGAALATSPELHEELARGLRNRLVVVAGDSDAAGQRFNTTLADGLRPYGIAVHALAVGGAASDLSAWREGDPSGFASALHSAVKAAEPIREGESGSVREGIRGSSADGTNGGASPAVANPASDSADGDTGALIPGGDEAARAVALVERLATRYGSSDVLNAHALVTFTGGRIKYAAGLGFYVWNGRIWERSETRVRQAVHYMGAALAVAASEVGDDDARKRLARAAKGFTLTRNIDSLMRELRAVPSVHVDVADFDARPHLLSFRNGTVNLRTGELRDHDKADMITYALDLDYVADAEAPRWTAFLEEIFPQHPELCDYFRRLCGYGITGQTDEQCFAVLWGKGANGKSVATDTLTNVFRGVTRTTGFATFEEKANGGIPNDLAALRGARLVMASEGEAGKPMSESVLKRATGKDEMQARFLRQEFFTFRPTFLIMLATNHQPKFRGQDEGLWRRVKLIPFTRWFAPAERDYTLDAKLLAEAEGIAAWAVRGAVEWYASGLRDPEVITNATREYRETSDALAGFYPGIMVPAADAQTPGDEAYTAYRDWCEAEGLQPREIWKRNTFYSAMAERGAQRKKTSKGIALVGVALADAGTGNANPKIFRKDG